MIKNGSGHFFGDYKPTFWQDQAYEASAYQNVSGISKRNLHIECLCNVWGEFDTNQLYIKNYGGAELNTAVVKTSEWTKNYNQKTFQLQQVFVKLGFYSKASGNA